MKIYKTKSLEAKEILEKKGICATSIENEEYVFELEEDFDISILDNNIAKVKPVVEQPKSNKKVDKKKKK